jgi:hypothetical protein
LVNAPNVDGRECTIMAFLIVGTYVYAFHKRLMTHLPLIYEQFIFINYYFTMRQRNTRQHPRNNVQKQIKDIRRELNPAVCVRPARADPPPTTTSKTHWIRRTYKVGVSSTGSASTTITFGALATAIGAPTSTIVKVMAVNVWNTASGGAVKADFDVQTVIVTNDPQSVVAEDYGTTSRLAGLHFDIPDPISESIQINPATSTVMMTLSNPGAASAFNNYFVAHFQCAIQVY